jgi:putative ABC transport system permease protein
MHELGHSWRRLARSPGFTAAAVVTLALGIGANAAIFSVLYAGFFVPYAIEDPDRLLRLYGSDLARDLDQLNLSVPKYEMARAQQTVFTSLEAANQTAFTLLDHGDAVQVTGAWTTAGFLQTFGARPVRGRFFEPGEEKGAPVAVVSESLWRSRFAGDPAVIGSTLRLAGATYTIVGVAPQLPAFWQAEVWLTDPFQLPGVPPDVLQRGVSFLATVGRLRPGVSREQAAAEMEVIAARYREQVKENADAAWRLYPLELRADIVGTSRGTLLTLLGAVGLVLLLACANVANLLLVRFSARRREIALRTALGAPRSRIVLQFLLESVTVSVLAGIAGTALAVWSLPALAALARDFVPFSDDIRVHVPVLAAALATALLTGLLMGAYPALQASRFDLVTALHEGGRSVAGGSGQTRTRNLLVSGQVAVSLLLLVAATLLLGSFSWLHRQAPGYRPDGVFVASLTLPASRYPAAGDQARLFLRMAAEMRAAPGVKDAALIQGLPLGGANSRAPYARVDGSIPPLKDRPLGLTRSVTPAYFSTLGIPVLAGRDFTERDDARGPLVVIVSRDTARRLFPDQDPIGRRVIMGSRDGGQEMEIVGVVGDVRSQTLAQTAAVEFYRPVMQRNQPFMQLAVRTAGDPASFASTARAVMKRLDPELALSGVTTLEEVVSQSLGQQRLLVRMLGLFAGLALTLAVVGIYSVVSYSVRQRSTDIGVRMALGARPRDVLGLTLGQGMMPVGAGLAVGLGACLALGRLLQSQLYGVSAFDPLTLAGAGAGLAVIAAVACWVPARRAARLDPVTTLRAE